MPKDESQQSGDLDEERLRAVLDGRNDPGYDPADHPIITEPDPDDPGSEAGH